MSTYSAKQVYITYSGVQITGYAPDTFCNIEWNTDDWKLMVGAGGEYVRSQSNDMSAKITIKLLPGSLSNSVLFGLYTNDRFSRTGALPLLVTDLSTGSTFAGNAWIMKRPNREYANEATVLEWTFESGDFEPVYGFSTGA
jgi:hypothetical protein